MKAPMTPDQARIGAALAALTAAVDRREWDRIPRLFSGRVEVDYTSLWGGEVQHVTPQELVEQWQAVLPGLDATRHQLGPVEAQVDGDRATAEAPIHGTHILGGGSWIAVGRYRCAFEKGEGGDWRLASLAYLAEREEGSRALMDRARENAATVDKSPSD